MRDRAAAVRARVDPDSAPQKPLDLGPAAALGQDRWYRLHHAHDLSPRSGRRWRNEPIEQMVALPDDQRPDVTPWLKDPRPIVRTNAAITLAWLGSADGRELLVKAVRDSHLRLEQRRAAAEALADLAALPPGDHDESPALDDLRKLLDEFGDTSAAHYLPELHAELIDGLARYVDPALDERFVVALRSPGIETRLLALSAWTQDGVPKLPAAAADLRADPHNRVRATALAALVARQHPQAVTYVRAALADFDVEVRMAAIAALGTLADAESRTALADAMNNDSELIRAAVVEALNRAGDGKTLRQAAGDKSWRVRAAVAAAIGRHHEPEDARLARELLADRSLEVQKSMLAALTSWPLEQAAPLLLETVETGAYLPRKLAAEQLAQRWQPARELSPDLPTERRLAMVGELKRQWHGARPDARGAVIAASANMATNEDSAAPAPGAVSSEQASRAKRRLSALGDERTPPAARQAALRELDRLGDQLAPTLEQCLREGAVSVPEIVWNELLADRGPEFEALQRLLGERVGDRRRAASRLAELAAPPHAPLGLLVVSRMADVLTEEDDALVWRSVFQVIARDGSEPAHRLAYVAIGHTLPDVRTLACQYLAAHPIAANAEVLLPALADSSSGVRAAAVRALAAPGVLDDPRPLEPLLASPDKSLQLETATALVRLKSDAGPPALERLAHDTDAEMRRRAAVRMGELGRDEFAPILVELLDDTIGVSSAAADSLAQVVGRDVSAEPDGKRASLLDRADRWKRWWARRHAGGSRNAASADR